MNENDIYITIGLNIKRIRESKNITQQELAYRCDFEKSNLSRIESGKTNITIKNLWKISKALEVDITELLINI